MARADTARAPNMTVSAHTVETSNAAEPWQTNAYAAHAARWAVQVLPLPMTESDAPPAYGATLGLNAFRPASVPVIVIDDFYPDVQSLRQAAAEPSADFVRDGANFYPGARRQAPADYAQFLQLLQPLLRQVYGATPWGPATAEPSSAESAATWQVLQAAFALTSTPPAQLRPIQMLPHFDTVSPNTLALVHYLVGPEHGGTSFYRHRSSGLCCITEPTLAGYGAALKQQAIAARLHEHPRYQAGDCALFQRIGQVTAAVNRVAIYPAHLLHSGDILQADGLSADPRLGRLTVSCLLQR